jgi:hypothetical protein
VGGEDIVRLEGRSDAIRTVSDHLEQFGAVEGEPDWLVSAVWLRADGADYLATPSTRVLPDGYIARPLTIDRADEFVRQLRSDLPDIAARLVGRRSDARLPESARPRAPSSFEQCSSRPLATSVLIRVATHSAAEHRIACGLLFSLEDHRLLVGTDPGTLAMVLSNDAELIERYLVACETLPTEEYLARYGC